MANTTFQYISKKYNAIVSGNAVVGEGATLQQHKITGGTLVLTGATPVVVLEPNVGANSVITLSLKTIGGTPAPYFISAVTAGTGFSVTGTAGDTSTLTYNVNG